MANDSWSNRIFTIWLTRGYYLDECIFHPAMFSPRQTTRGAEVRDIGIGTAGFSWI